MPSTNVRCANRNTIKGGRMAKTDIAKMFAQAIKAPDVSRNIFKPTETGNLLSVERKIMG